MTIIIVILLGVSIGCAVVSTVFNINESSRINKITWDVHFEKIRTTKGSVSAKIPAKLNSKKTSVNFEVHLDRPGDFYEFLVDVVNDGKMDAKIGTEPILTGISGEYKDFIKYSVEYLDGSVIKSNDVLNRGSRETIVVRVEYNDEITFEMMPEEIQSFNLGFALDYIQK